MGLAGQCFLDIVEVRSIGGGKFVLAVAECDGGQAAVWYETRELSSSFSLDFSARLPTAVLSIVGA